MTLIDLLRMGNHSELVEAVAREENRSAEFVRQGIIAGTIVIPKNNKRKLSKPCGIGEGLKTKINANIGTSKDSSCVSSELEKASLAIELGSDAIMDLSTGHGISDTRKKVIACSQVPVGTVPLYEIVIEGMNKFGSVKNIPFEFMLDVIERQASDGVDFFTLHAGITKEAIRLVSGKTRVLDIVSRGGALLAEWMVSNNTENPFYEHFGKVLDILKKYDVTLSLGDGLRPGSIADATDQAQISELATLGQLQKISLASGVQVIIEGPGHVPINQIETNVLLQKSLCNRAPFYVLGPLVTDVAPGYDHITSAIGGAMAASFGADFLCYVTPSEHLRLPSLDDVRDGVVAAKIAAHAGDIAKGVKGAMDWDISISRARRSRNWKKQFELALDKSKPAQYRDTSKPGSDDVCSMCGEYCSIKISEKCFNGVPVLKKEVI